MLSRIWFCPPKFWSSLTWQGDLKGPRRLKGLFKYCRISIRATSCAQLSWISLGPQNWGSRNALYWESRPVLYKLYTGFVVYCEDALVTKYVICSGNWEYCYLPTAARTYSCLFCYICSQPRLPWYEMVRLAIGLGPSWDTRVLSGGLRWTIPAFLLPQVCPHALCHGLSCTWTDKERWLKGNENYLLLKLVKT